MFVFRLKNDVCHELEELRVFYKLTSFAMTIRYALKVLQFIKESLESGVVFLGEKDGVQRKVIFPEVK